MDLEFCYGRIGLAIIGSHAGYEIVGLPGNDTSKFTAMEILSSRRFVLEIPSDARAAA